MQRGIDNLDSEFVLRLLTVLEIYELIFADWVSLALVVF